MVESEVLQAPCFLIAVPQLGDPNFNRGVVFLLEHGDEGSMGIVINKPSDLDMGTFCASQDMEFNGNSAAVVFQGGPVQTDRAFILHASSHQGPETEEVLGGTRLSYSLESLRMIVDSPPEQLRVFLGYAGWAEGQLAEEISAGAWLVADPVEPLIYSATAETVWEKALRGMGIDPMQLMHSGAVH